MSAVDLSSPEILRLINQRVEELAAQRPHVGLEPAPPTPVPNQEDGASLGVAWATNLFNWCLLPGDIDQELPQDVGIVGQITRAGDQSERERNCESILSLVTTLVQEKMCHFSVGVEVAAGMQFPIRTRVLGPGLEFRLAYMAYLRITHLKSYYLPAACKSSSDAERLGKLSYLQTIFFLLVVVSETHNDIFKTQNLPF
jgi:hypothetical protein